MKGIAFFISRFFDPAIITAFLIWLMIWLSPLELFEKFIWIVIFEIFNFVIPLVLFIYMRRTKKVSDVDISNKIERLPLFRLTTVLYGISFFLSLLFGLPQEIVITAFAAFMIIAIWTIITPFWKISVHIAGITTAVSIIYFLTNLDWIGWLGPILILIIAWSRYVQNKHTFKQLVGALILSSILVIGIVSLFKGTVDKYHFGRKLPLSATNYQKLLSLSDLISIVAFNNFRSKD